MYRISTNMPNDDLRFSMLRHDYNLAQDERRIGTGNRINQLRDDPVAAAHSTRLKSNMHRTRQYESNVAFARSRYNEAEGHITQQLEIIHRLQDLARQASNGTYSEEDRLAMAQETNELLNGLVNIANQVGEGQRAIFGGDDTKGEPFMITQGRVPQIIGEAVTRVEYMGSYDKNYAEIDENNHLAISFPGSEIFWGDNHQLYSRRDATNYVVSEDSTISIDGHSIELNRGDNLQTIISKINSSNAAVKASTDPITGAISLKTTVPHQLFLDENPNSTVLKDLGILSEVGNKPPFNLHSDVISSGGSLFDAAITMRDALISNDYDQIATTVLAGLDSSLNTVIESLTDIGALTARLDILSSRLSKEGIDYQAYDSILTDTNLTDTVVQMEALKNTQKAAYQAAGQVLKPTLMDFLR